MRPNMSPGINQRPLFGVHYRKLIEDTPYSNYAPKETITFVPPLTVSEYFSYSCQQCGHHQDVKAEELNSIVGNCFRMAYATQLKKQPTLETRRNNFSDNNVIRREQDTIWNKVTRPCDALNDSKIQSTINSHTYNRNIKRVPPNTMPGLKTIDRDIIIDNHHRNIFNSSESTPTSDESNSPTELNSYKRLLEKPPLIKSIQFKSIKESSYLEDGYPSVRPIPEGCISFQQRETTLMPTDKYDDKTLPVANEAKKLLDVQYNCSKSASENSSYNSSDSDNNFSRNSISVKCLSPAFESNNPIISPPPPPPLPPEREDSLLKRKEETELKSAPWFQAGIPREITLEVLSQEPVGAFMVRESTTKPGCFALSVRVPREFHSRGIAHYLILKTMKGYKIKGFTKEFSTLTALITHHSVMQELLPCPLSLSRYNPSFTKSDTSKDFADIDSDPDYNTLADFRKMMADLNV